MKLPKWKKKQKVIVGAVVIVGILAAGVGTYMVSAAGKNKDKEEVPQYETVFLGKQDVTKEIGLSGKLDSAHSESVSSTLTGVKIKEILVQVGDQVKAGDILFQLDSTEIENKLKGAENTLTSEKEKNSADITSSQRNYADAQATQNVESQRSGQNITDASGDYQASQDNKNQAENEYQNAKSASEKKEKELNKAKDKLDELKSDEKTKQDALKEAQKEGDEAAIQKAQKDCDSAAGKRTSQQEKITGLEAEIASLKETIGLREAAVKEAEAGIAAAEDTLQKAKEQQEDSSRSNQKNVADSKDNLDAAKRNATGGSTTAQEVENYKKELENCTVRAASDGVVTSISAKVGDTYTTGVLATIQDEKNYIVTAMVGQYDISDIKKGMKASIGTETTGEEDMKGTVTFVSPVPGTAPGSGEEGAQGGGASGGSGYEVQITVENPSERLRIGMTAKVKLIQDEVKNVFAVPYDCITETPDGTYTIQVLKDGTPQEMTVKKGLETDYYTEISGEGLEEGMEIVVPDAMDMDAGGMSGGMSMSIY